MTYKFHVLTSLWLLLVCMIFYLSSCSNFYQTFFMISSYFVFISILGLLNRSLLTNICADSLRLLILQRELEKLRTLLKESENKDKYLDLARELKQLANMKVTITRIVNGAFGTVTKELIKGLEDLEIRGRVETIQTTTLLRTARKVRRVLWKTIS